MRHLTQLQSNCIERTITSSFDKKLVDTTDNQYSDLVLDKGNDQMDGRAGAARATMPHLHLVAGAPTSPFADLLIATPIANEKFVYVDHINYSSPPPDTLAKIMLSSPQSPPPITPSSSTDSL